MFYGSLFKGSDDVFGSGDSPVSEAIVTVNAGSSSAKLGLFRIGAEGVDPEAALRIDIFGIGGKPELRVRASDAELETTPLDLPDADAYEVAFETAFSKIRERSNGVSIIGVGHRMVHGGTEFMQPVQLGEKEIRALEALIPLAPRHQPHNLRGVKSAARQWPSLPQIACFDTAFHRTQSNIAQSYALPRDLGDGELIRFGFHGLSYEYVTHKVSEVIGEAASGRMIIAHLGAGASMCAVRDGKSIATTMGFTALDGLPMATRCGAIDPGVLLYLLEQKGMSPESLSDCLYNQSGLLGLSGLSGDMQALEISDDPQAKEAIDYFVDRAVREIGSLTAALGGLECLIFTGGIGENSVNTRRRIVEGSAWLGFALDQDANSNHESCITRTGTTPSAWVIPTDEEYMIARHTYRMISAH